MDRPFGMPPGGDQRAVVVVQGDHGLRADLRAVAGAAHTWLSEWAKAG